MLLFEGTGSRPATLSCGLASASALSSTKPAIRLPLKLSIRACGRSSRSLAVVRVGADCLKIKP